MYWKNSWWRNEAYPSCKTIDLPEGMLISHYIYSPVKHMLAGNYRQQCYQNAIPMLNTNMGLVIDKFTKPLPVVEQSWKDFTLTNVRGSFAYSVVSIIYAISISFVIIWFLTLFVLTNYTIKPSLLMKASTTLSSVYILWVVIKSFLILHSQQRQGFLHGAMLLDSINANLPINIIDLIVVLLLQINQVQIIMRIFSRSKDKRTAFYIGVIAAITSQVIWAVSKFHIFADTDEAGDILPAFIYLVRIVMGLCYAAIISVYLLTKIYYIIANKSIWLLSILTFILIYSPVAFFIADVSNAFVYELSEIFSVVTYVICVVIPWEWCNKFNLIRKAKEKEGVLGRRFYEDELYELDRFELFVEQEPDPEEDGTTGGDVESAKLVTSSSSASGNQGVQNEVPKETQVSKTNKILTAWRNTKDAFLYLTDEIIAAGFAIPRSVSVSTQSIDRPKNSHLDGMDAQINRHATSTLRPPETARDDSVEREIVETESSPGMARNGRNVFVYSRKEVVLDLSDDD